MLSPHQKTNGAQNTEAKTVILLVKNASNFSKVDHYKWLLIRLYQPLLLESDDNFQVLHISDTRLTALIQSQNEKEASEIYTPQNLPDLQHSTDKQYRLMPHSRIITLSTKYRFVFLLDVTSSLATIDCSGAKNTIMSKVMQITHRCLEGLVQPFIIQDLDKDRALQFEPEISVTIIAECSNFASNANLIPMLAEFPTMRVLIQGVVVNRNNIFDILDNLHSEFIRFQHEVAEFRQKLRRNKFPVAYVMDVTGPKTDLLEHELGSNTSYLDEKNLWRLGSSGGNLAYSLNAGLLAINLLPKEGSPALMVITDGVVKSNLAQMSPDDDIIQMLCKESIKCNIIQVGPLEGGNPGCNFGFLPDNEILQFVATATSGKFLYSEDCPNVRNVKSSKFHLSREDLVPPNFYHINLLMKETYFTKRKGHTSYSNNTVNSGERTYNFPWDPDPRSLPPAVEAMSTRYREYSLSIDVMQLIFARIRNGFNIESVILVGRNTNKAEKVHITMSRLWLPNVIIQYKIKASWMGEVNGFSRLKSPRIEINVVADTVLAIYLLNFQTAQQNNDPSHPLFLKCIRLHKFMTMIYETDELLKKHIFHKQLWDPLEQSLMRQNINIWYDKAKFDILISGEQSITNKSVKMPSDNSAYSALKERLKVAWSSFSFSENGFVKAFHPLEGDKILPISFCELRFNKELGSLVTGNLSFFNVEVFQRQKALEDLINLINELNSNEDGDGQLFYVCKRPLSSFLIKYPENGRHESEILLDNRQVTGRDCIVKSYLRHWRWTWLSDIEHIFSLDSKNMPIQDLAFQHLCQARLDEGCLLISENSNQQVFYRELELGGNSDLGSSANLNKLYGIQHHIYKDPYTGEILTELWMEPLQQPFLRELYESVADRISTADRQKLSQLVTFDQIHYIAKSRVSHLRNSYNLTPQKSSHLPSLFNLPVLLRSSGLLIANYDIPTFKSSSNIINNQVHQHLHLQSVKSSYMSNENTPRSSFGDSRSPLISESSPYLRKGSISNRNSPYMEVASQKKLSLSLPNNSTHDVTYIISRDSIAPLGPLDRDFALLHLFVEKTFSNYADGEVDTNNNGLKDSLLKEIYNGLSKIDFLQEATSTIEYIRNLRDTRCFIKIVDSGSLLLVIIPSFKLLLDTMKLNNGLISSNKPCFMNILIFLCKRPQPIQRDFIKEPVDFRRDQTLSFETISLLHKTPDTIKNPLEPKLLSSSFPENPVNSFKSNLSDQVAQVTLNITKLYVHGFVKSVYASILQKHRVTETDFLKAIDACMETSVDIDITGYVNVHVKAARQGLDSDDANDVYQKFVAVLGHYFEPANFINDELQNIYYYRPNFKKPNNLSKDIHDNVADIAGTFLDVFNYAENPLFLRLECTFKKASTLKVEDIESEGSSSVKFPISSLPTSYLCTVDGKFHDFSPKSIGTETSPVKSSDGTTAILHLICLTLARFDEMTPGFHVGDNETSALENLPQLDSLTADKKEALSETRDRIDWLLKEEMMHGLLRSQPVEKSVLSFIQKQLMPKNPFVDFPTTFSVPLSFVRRKQGQDRFLKEFSKADMSPFSLNQVEDCFYISEDEEKGESLAVVDNSCVTSPIFELNNIFESSSIEAFNNQEEAYDDYTDDGGEGDLCQGLGISIYSPEENDFVPDPADQTVKSSVKKNVIHKQLFWLLLIPQENSIQMYFYSKAVSAIERSNIIKHVRNCIIQISERINRLILLDELNETRRCSKYLVPPDGSSDSESSSEDSDLSSGDLVDVLSMAPNDGNITVSKKFKPGQFECQSVYKQTFPLHWRLRPNQALNGIASSILDPFVVSNRKHMFVIAKNHNIVYLKLSEVEASPIYIDDESLDDSSRQNSSFTLSSELQSNADELRKSPSSKSGGSPNTSPNSRKHGTQTRVADSRELVVEVFGLDVPGKEITEELMALLENKLNSSITLTVMSTFLARNPYKVNPTRAQNISLYLNILQGLEVSNAIRRHHISKYGSVEFPESISESGRKTPSATHDIHFHEFTFFYNYISQSRTPSAFEASVGQGIAGLCFTLLNRQGRPTFELLVPEIVDSDDINSNKILQYISNDEWFVVSDSNKDSNDNNIDASYQILIELWNHGTLNYSIILDRIIKSFRQCLCDYFIEVSITKGLGRVSLDCVESNNIQVAQNFDQDDTISSESMIECVEPHVQHNFIEPVLALLKKAIELENPALHALHARLDMPSWMMDDFLSEVHELLVELNVIFTPIILRTIPASFSPMYEIYRPKHSIFTPDDSISIPHQYLLIAGLKEMNTKYGSCKSILPDDRRGSFGSDVSHSRRSSTEDISNEKANSNSRKSSLMSVAAQQRHLLEDIMMYTISNGDQTNRNTPDLFRSCFLVMSIDGFDLSVYIYNWVKQHADQ
ncbi:3737_t:CDS:10, partial [Funneliformis mosseae]